MTDRMRRLESLFLEEIARFVSKNYGDKFEGVLTITGVKLDKNLRAAKIYYSVFGENTKPDEQLFADIKKELAHFLAKRVSLKRIPSFSFLPDDTASNAAKLEAIFRKIEKEK